MPKGILSVSLLGENPIRIGVTRVKPSRVENFHTMEELRAFLKGLEETGETVKLTGRLERLLECS